MLMKNATSLSLVMFMVVSLVHTSSTMKIPAYPSMNLCTSWKAKTDLFTTVQLRAKKLTCQVKQRPIHIIQVRNLSFLLKCAYCIYSYKTLPQIIPSLIQIMPAYLRCDLWMKGQLLLCFFGGRIFDCNQNIQKKCRFSNTLF